MRDSQGKLVSVRRTATRSSVGNVIRITICAFVVACVVANVWLVSDAMRQEAQIRVLTTRLEVVERSGKLTPEPNEDRLADYFQAVDEKTDTAIDRLLAVNSVCLAAFALFGALMVFKTPRDLEKRLDAMGDIATSASAAAEDAQYSAELIAALSYHAQTVTNARRVRSLTELIDKYPRKPLAYYHRALVYAQMAAEETDENRARRLLNQALADFQIARTLGVGEALYANNVGAVYQSLKEHKRAITWLTKAVELDPEECSGYINRARAYAEAREFDEALEDLDAAERIDPDSLDLLLARADVYEEMAKRTDDPEEKRRRLESARADIRAARKLDPDLRELEERDARLEEALPRFRLSRPWATPHHTPF